MKLITNKVALLLFVMITATVNLHAQSSSTKKEKVEKTKKQTSAMTKATNDFKALRYASAIPLLSKIVEEDASNVSAMDMLAYSYKMTKNYGEALKWYDELTKKTPLKPIWALYYAEALANNQNYERSEGWYRKFLALAPGDKRAAAFAGSNLNSFSKNIGNWKVSFTNLNTQSSEYSPIFYKNGLIFSSNRPTDVFSKRVFAWDNTPFTNLYFVPKLSEIKTINPDSAISATLSKGGSSYKFNDDDTAPTSNDTKNLGVYNASIQRDTLRAALIGSMNPKLLKGSANTKFHEGTSAVFPDGSIIFTRNNYFKGTSKSSSDGTNKLKLFIGSGDNLGHITEFPYNSNEYSTGHPALSKDGTVLVFASDMPGGYGGTDLYYCIGSGSGPGSWSRPINMGSKINTEGNEMFPFLDKSGNLYFSSTGLAGLGGLDIFEVELKEMKPISAPKNLGVPINTSKDDFSLIKNDDGKSGYFSSNRRGNDDIYKFQRASYMIILEGKVTDANTHAPLAGSRILMRHLDGIDTLRTNNKGEFRREMPRETDFETNTQKIGYVSKLGFVSSLGITKDTVIKMDIRLRKTENEQQYVLNNCDSLKKVFAVKNIYYDLDRSEIRPDARPALDELVALMRKYPDITVITSSHCDSRASEDYNRNLSLRRGASAKAYLIAKGISSSRVSVEYYGKTRLVNRCFDGVPCSEENQQLNRRTEFDVIVNGVNITQQNCDDK